VSEESVPLNNSVGARFRLSGIRHRGAGGENGQGVDMFRTGMDTFTELGGRFYLGQGFSQMGRRVLCLETRPKMSAFGVNHYQPHPETVS